MFKNKLYQTSDFIFKNFKFISSLKLPQLISVSIQSVQNDGHSWFINTSFDFKYKIELDVLYEKPSLIVQINWFKIIFLFDGESWWIGNVELLLNWLRCFQCIIGWSCWFNLNWSFYSGATFEFIPKFINWGCYRTSFLLYFNFFDIIGFILIPKS